MIIRAEKSNDVFTKGNATFKSRNDIFVTAPISESADTSVNIDTTTMADIVNIEETISEDKKVELVKEAENIINK